MASGYEVRQVSMMVEVRIEIPISATIQEPELIEAAQVASPTVSQAVSRMATAQGNQAAAQAALLPQVSAQMAASRGVTQPGLAEAITQQVGLQAS